jgi:hypothetical protein
MLSDGVLQQQVHVREDSADIQTYADQQQAAASEG